MYVYQDTVFLYNFVKGMYIEKEKGYILILC